MVRKRDEWAIERAHYERIFLSRTRKKTKIHAITSGSEIGFTTEKGEIYLAREHSVFGELDETEKKFCRMGVFAHEMLHQIFSDFRILEAMHAKLSATEYQIYHEFMNILEDSYIEWRAPVAIGGRVLKSLRFMITHVWKWSNPISDVKSPFGQLIAALINFGDLGKVKGDFTFPEAEECFQKIAPIFNQGVTEISSEKRNEYALEMMEISRPLWEAEANLNEMLQELLSKMGKGDNPTSSEAPLDDSDSVPMDSSEIDKIREETIRKISEAVAGEGGSASVKADDESADKSEDESKSGASDSETDSSESKSDSSESKSGESDSKSDSDQPSTSKSKTSAEKDGESEGCDSKKEAPDKKEDSEVADSKTKSSEGDDPKEESPEKKEDSEDSDSEKGESKEDSESCDSKKEDSEIPDYSIDKTDEDWLHDTESKIEEELEKEEEEAKEFEIDPDIEPSIYEKGMFSIENTTPTYSDIDQYQYIVAENKPAIIGLKSKLSRIFRNDATRKEHRKTGKVNVKRLYGSRQTSRVFDRKTSPKDLDDLAVFIAVDESYSMNRPLPSSIRRCNLAKRLAICLTEVFSSLKIPIYVMGFTADNNGYEANHNHYVKWKATETEKGKLVNIGPVMENFDSLSLSYASEILKKKKAKHKLMIVLSDGVPLCHSVSMEQGYRDVKEAVQNTRKQGMSVLGVAIGNDSTEQIQYLYGKNFIHAKDVDHAFLDISTEISKIVKTW